MLKLGDRTSLRCVRKRTEASNTAERIVDGECESNAGCTVHLVLDIPLGRGTLGSRVCRMSNAEVSASLHES